MAKAEGIPRHIEIERLGKDRKRLSGRLFYELKKREPKLALDDVQGEILNKLRDIENATSMKELRLAESVAGRYYWQVWSHLLLRFDKSWDKSVPDHWRKVGPRTSRIDRKRAKRALTPAHAIVNYLYAILECEATIAAQRMGFDPSLGLMHVDKRYRPSLSSDLMEPARTAADEMALDLIESHEFRRGEVVETRQGVCRLGPELARSFADAAPVLREAVAPHAEELARQLLADEDHPTPLTRRRHMATRQESVTAPRDEAIDR